MPRIYVASLSDYNAGRLHGAWIDLDGKSADDVMAEVREMLAASPCAHAEEWAIHDAEGFALIDESRMTITALCDLTRAMDTHGDIALDVVADGMCDASDVDEYMRDHYAGVFDSLEDYAQETLDMSGWPDVARDYFDWDAFCRDLELGGDVSTIRLAGKVHVFTA